MEEKCTIFEELVFVLRSVFQKQSITLIPESCFSDIDGWDSLHHAFFIAAIEKHFKIKFKISEILNFKTVGNICNAIEEKLRQQD